MINKNQLLIDPFDQFALWFKEAQAQEKEPSAMTLATVTREYEITARIVLLKAFDQEGFVFFTNYQSPKAQALKEIPFAALVFWWPHCQKQVRITGKVVVAADKQSDLYFAERSKGSRIAAIVSEQSQPIANKEVLLNRFETLSHRYADQEAVPRPSYWGGYQLQPTDFEFWQSGEHRLHDRFQYRKKSVDKDWEIIRLSP